MHTLEAGHFPAYNLLSEWQSGCSCILTLSPALSLFVSSLFLTVHPAPFSFFFYSLSLFSFLHAARQKKVKEEVSYRFTPQNLTTLLHSKSELRCVRPFIVKSGINSVGCPKLSSLPDSVLLKLHILCVRRHRHTLTPWSHQRSLYTVICLHTTSS